jgi:hypothetical protein
MIDLAAMFRQALRHDPVLQTTLGYDADGEYKVYASLGKQNMSAPYLVFDIVPLNDILAVIGDGEAIEAVPVTLKSWGRQPREAWHVASYADDAIKQADFVATPWEVISVRRTSTPFQLDDPDTNLIQVVVQYEVILAR